MAIACNPRLLIADEPTTALDVTDPGADPRPAAGTAARTRHGPGADHPRYGRGRRNRAARALVMYAGQIVEDRRSAALFAQPRHPYTAALLDALPERSLGDRRLPTIPGVVPGLADRPDGLPIPSALPLCRRAMPRRSAGLAGDRPVAGPLPLSAGPGAMSAATADDRGRSAWPDQGLSPGAWALRAGGDIAGGRRASSSTSTRGRTLAVVGESGCGKSTLARIVTLIEPPTAGSLRLCRRRYHGCAAGARPRRPRRHVQFVFQDPYGSLNPRHRVGTIIAEPLAINTKLRRTERIEAARAMMARVGLRPEHYEPLSAHVLGRPTPAHRHRARADAESRAGGCRRAGVGARRLDPGAGPQSADGPAAGIRHGLSVHLARALGGAAHRRRGDGHVSRPRRRAGTEGRSVRAAAPSLHPCAVGQHAFRRSRPAARACR